MVEGFQKYSMDADMARMLIAACLLWFVAGCDTLDSNEIGDEVVVESYLVAGEALPEVRLTRTIPIDDVFDPDELGIRDADVRVELLGPDGLVERSYAYAMLEDEPGVYYPLEGDAVKPLRTYRLAAAAPGADGLITATTTVPGTLSVTSINRDTVVYRSSEQLRFVVSSTPYLGRQNYYILTTSALEPLEARLTPFAKAIFDDGDVTLDDLSQSVSPLINEENFDRPEAGTIEVRYPWLGLNFYGRNRAVLQALDDNLHDFVRSQSVQQGGSTLPPGEIPNVLENVDGGRGIFGSVARASVEFVVLPSPSDG